MAVGGDRTQLLKSHAGWKSLILESPCRNQCAAPSFELSGLQSSVR